MKLFAKLAALAVCVAALGCLSDPVYATGRHGGKRRHRHRHRRAADCQPVTDNELSKQLDLEQSLNLHESFYQLDALKETSVNDTLEAFQKFDRGPVGIHRTPIGDDSPRSCDQGFKRETPGGNITDPCPFIQVLSVDLNRHPSVLVETLCLPCEECLAGSGSGAPSRTRCQEVTYMTRVLRKLHCPRGQDKVRFVPVWEPLTVGCACREAPARETTPTTQRVHPVPPHADTSLRE